MGNSLRSVPVAQSPFKSIPFRKKTSKMCTKIAHIKKMVIFAGETNNQRNYDNRNR